MTDSLKIARLIYGGRTEINSPVSHFTFGNEFQTPKEKIAFNYVGTPFRLFYRNSKMLGIVLKILFLQRALNTYILKKENLYPPSKAKYSIIKLLRNIKQNQKVELKR